jgi:hypothetical protein
MRAFVYKSEPDIWTPIVGTGIVTPEYKSIENLRRCYLHKHLLPGRWIVEVFNNWERRYQAKPDRIIGLDVAQPVEGNPMKRFVETVI